jgi:predicted ATPase/class 3 adenylate cyclase
MSVNSVLGRKPPGGPSTGPLRVVSLLGGASERKQVSVLFADLCESTRRVAGRDPEEARAALDAALGLLCAEVEAFGGIVSQLLGDGVLALFGAPVAQEDHALRACLCALSLHRQAHAAAAGGDAAPVFRVGIDSGEVAVGSVREFRATHYRADGSTIHSAKRLEQSAPPGGTLIGAATLRLVGDQIEVARRVELDAKGFDEPLQAYELERSAVASLARRRQLAPLVGRESVLAQIHALAADARAGKLRFVGLRGEPGIGKSRLAGALAEQLASDGFTSCWVTARAYAPHQACGVITELARALLELPHDALAEALREAVQAAVPGGQASALADLFDLGDADAAWPALTPAQRRRQLADALMALALRRLARGPLLIVIDDLYYIDRESQRLLEHLVKRLEQQAVLICGAYRPDYTPRWSDASWFSEHLIGPLPFADVEKMAIAIAGADPSLDELRTQLVERAGGNPFFLEQMAMALVDEGVLVGQPGDYRRDKAAAPLQPPASIAALIAARVDRLPAAAKVALECAAVLGDPVVPSRIARMTAHGQADVEVLLRQAGAAGLLAASGSLFGFRHALVQETLVRSLPWTRRKQLHRAAYEALRGDGAEPAAEDAGRLAQHAFAGEAWPETVECAIHAVSRAVARSAHRDALIHFALGLEAASRAAPEVPRLRELCLDLRMEVLGALMPLGKVDEAVDNLEKAHAITRALGDLRRESGVSLQLAVIHWVQGNYARGLEAAAMAEATAQRMAGRSAQMAAHQARMMLRHGQGRYRETLADARRIQAEFAQELSARPLMARWAVMAAVNVHAFAADTCAAMGDFAAAQAACDAGYAELATRDHAFSRSLLDFVQGSVWLLQGRCHEAAALLAQAREQCTLHDVRAMEPPIVTRLCVAMSRIGQVAQALALIERVTEEGLAHAGGRYNAYYFPASHASVLLEAGSVDAALARAHTALAEARRYGQRGHEAEGSMLVADIAARAGDLPLSSEHYANAAAIAAECGMARLEQSAASRLRALAARTPPPAGQHDG